MSLKQCHSTWSLASSFLDIIFLQLCLSPRAILYDWGWTSFSNRVEHGSDICWRNWVRELPAVLFATNKMADRTCRLLDGKEASDFIASMDTFIFDCDGKWGNQLRSRFGCNCKEVMWDITTLQGCFGMKAVPWKGRWKFCKNFGNW